MAEHDSKPEVAVTEEQPALSRCELYEWVDYGELRLRGSLIGPAGFTSGRAVRIRVMPECIVITALDSRELWGCIEGLSVARINRKKVSQWLKDFPGALRHTCEPPRLKRWRSE